VTDARRSWQFSVLFVNLVAMIWDIQF
jgi:hypothetical protein